MKRLHLFSLFLGLVLGLLISTSLPFLQVSRAGDDKKEQLSPEEIDKRLDEILESQKDLKKRLDATLEQTRLLKATAGK